MPTVPLYRRIADAYRARIEAGVYAPGDKLPGQKTIAAEWECSLQPVKWALRELELAGLIETHQGIGSYVKVRPEPDNL